MDFLRPGLAHHATTSMQDSRWWHPGRRHATHLLQKFIVYLPDVDIARPGRVGPCGDACTRGQQAGRASGAAAAPAATIAQ